MTARWSARLSALLFRGNAAVQRAARYVPLVSPRPWEADASSLPHLLPEGDCGYELLCGQWDAASDAGEPASG